MLNVVRFFDATWTCFLSVLLQSISVYDIGPYGDLDAKDRKE